MGYCRTLKTLAKGSSLLTISYNSQPIMKGACWSNGTDSPFTYRLGKAEGR